jgi:hypothetical protein
MEVEVSFTAITLLEGLMSDHVSFDPILHCWGWEVEAFGKCWLGSTQIDIHQFHQLHKELQKKNSPFVFSHLLSQNFPFDHKRTFCSPTMSI